MSHAVARPFAVYVHVPFCASRCGYCAFNTYTAADLGTDALRVAYPDAAIAEVRHAASVVGPRSVSSVFFGGGTPTMLPVLELARILAAIDDAFGLEPGAEVSIEANPDSVDRVALDGLVAAGFNRISFGMQSVRAHVLAVLERSHTPGAARVAVEHARAAGFAHLNLDCIYGTPGERADDWAATLDAVLAAPVDHVSAYALTVEPRTRLAAQVRSGRVPSPHDEALAQRYEEAEAALSAAGFSWYELSNWAKPGGECRHNLHYWHGDDWWGVGPGAHSHLDGRRWVNVAHPRDYVDRLAADAPLAVESEVLDAEARRLERLLTETRLATGCPLDALTPRGSAAAAQAAATGWLEPSALAAGRAVLSFAGRQVADSVIAALAV